MAKGLDKRFLERCLANGMSLPEIGKLVGRPAGTVGYWVKQHGLVANGAAKYAPKGQLDRETLEVLVGRGCSIREIAAELHVSTGRVRYWIQRYELGKTGNGRRAGKIAEARAAGRASIHLECPRHGYTDFWLGSEKVRCKRCNSEAVARRRRNVKQILVAEAGGRCRVCGYDRSMAALQFHHLDPRQKAFGIASNGHTKALDLARREAAKCVLLCANCHAEVEAGMVNLATVPTLIGVGRSLDPG